MSGTSADRVPERAIRDPYNGWIVFCRTVFYPLTWLLGRRHFSGMEHLQIPTGALIIGNHVSNLDPVYNAVYIRKAHRWPHFLAKASIWKVPVAGAVMRGTRQIPVTRDGGAGQQALQPAIDALAANEVVVIYPEGTITRDPAGWPMKPKVGAAVLALSGDFPVIPMVTWGTQKVLKPYVKKGFKPFPRKDIIVKLGPPIDLSAWRGKEADSRAIRDVSMLLMSTVRDMEAEIRGETAPTKFFVPRKVTEGATGTPGPTVADPAPSVAPPPAGGSPA